MFGLIDLADPHGRMSTTRRSRTVPRPPRGCENLRSRRMKPSIHIGSCTTKAVYHPSIYGIQTILAEPEVLLELLSLKKVCTNQGTKVLNDFFNLLSAMTPMTAYEPEGSWDSIHVFETAERGRQAHYKLTSTVMLQLLTRKGTDNDGPGKGDTDSGGPYEWRREGEVNLSGSMTRQVCMRNCCSRPELRQCFG